MSAVQREDPGIICDLAAKASDDVIDAVDRTLNLLAHPEDRLAVALIATGRLHGMVTAYCVAKYGNTTPEEMAEELWSTLQPIAVRNARALVEAVA